VKTCTIKGSVYLALGIAAIGAALLVPAQLRCLDEEAVVRAGAPTRTVLVEAAEQLRLDKPGLAVLLVKAGVAADVPGAAQASQELEAQMAARPVPAVWGPTDSLLQQVCGKDGLKTDAGSVLEVILPSSRRAAALEFLQSLRRADDREVLRHRELANTVAFPPVSSASGQALDAAVLLTGLLMQAEAMRPALRQEIEVLAATANRGGDSTPIERVYLDLSSLAKRMTWDQLVWFLGRVKDLTSLRQLTSAIMRAPGELPVVFAALVMAESPDAVVTLLRDLPKTASADLRFALGTGKGGLDLLLARQQPIHRAPWRSPWVALPGLAQLWSLLVWISTTSLAMALLFKYLLWFDGAFCLARAFSLLKPEPSDEEEPLVLPFARTLRQQTVAALALMLAVILTEPGLARTPAPVSAVIWVPAKSRTVAAVETSEPKRSMNPESNWLALAVFFTVQLAVYVIGLIKLREIKRQELPSALKLRVLDNEENLFDTGLYVGLGGTGLSLVLLALNLFTASPMIAYASTGFGVFFASLLKIVHVRSYRRRLILQADLETQQVPS